MERRKDSLIELKQCRFCLTDDDTLQSLYFRNKPSRNNAVTLPMKILSSVSMEVFPSDKMPTYICKRCLYFMEVCYEFKQICRNADESIFKFIQSGTELEPVTWPQMLTRAFKNGQSKKPSRLKTMVEDGTRVEVTPQDMSESEEDNANVYNVKVEDGMDEESARIKVVTGNNDTKRKSKPRNKDDEDVEESPAGADSFVGGRWACDECDSTYTLQQLLELHKMEKHGQDNKPDTKFHDNYDSLNFKRRVTLFECVACGKKFDRHTLLKRHEKTQHADIAQNHCPHCPATYLSKEEMETHRATCHDGAAADGTYNCKDCGKKFAQRLRLKNHIYNVHSRPKKWACRYCPMRFTSPTKLGRHLRTHAGDRQYPCKYCKKTFIKVHHYKRHLRVKHQDSQGAIEQYRCEQCEDTFGTQDELIYHSAIHATQNLTCPLCQEKFEDVDAVTAHIKSHVTEEEFMCDFCELVFTCKEKLDMHTLAAHEDELQNSMEFEENESSMDMDAEPEDAEEDDTAINIKQDGDELLLEIKKPEEFMLSHSQDEAEERGDNTNSEESEAEASYTELATVNPLAMSKPAQMPQLVAAPAVAVAAPAPAPVTAKPEVPSPAKNAVNQMPPLVAAPAFTVVAPAAPAPAPVIAKPEDPSTRNVMSSQDATKAVLKKAEIVKRKVIQQTPIETVPEKKEKPVSKENNSSAGPNDKSLRLLEKELQELKRTTNRNEIPKTPAKSVEPLRSSRRPQLHTSTPKPKPVEEKKPVNAKATEKKVPERRSTKENKEAKESKDTKTKDDSKAKAEEKEKELKEPDTPKSAVKNGDKTTPDDGPVRRSTRPSKVKDYAKMVRDRPQGGSDDDDESEDDDEEYVEEEKNESHKPRRGSLRPAVPAKPTPAKTPEPAKAGQPPPRKRGRPRKTLKEEPEVAPKMRKDEKVEEGDKNETQEELENPKSKGKVADENDENKASDENGNADASKTDKDTKKTDTVMSPTGATLKKVGTLPPGIKALPLPKGRAMGPAELCEMQIGKKVVKVQKIVMTKAEVEAMAKKGLVEMKDGTMVLKQGIKLPAKDPVAIKSSLVGEEASKESPTKKYKSAPMRCDFDDET